MQVCPWCEGRTIVGRIVYSEDGPRELLAGMHLAVGLLKDMPCSTCKGTGQVDDRRFAQLTGTEAAI